MEQASGKGRGKDIVALGAILGAAIWGTWLFVRSELDLGSGWTDGQQSYDSVRGERIRYAVWDAPRAMAGELNGPEAEAQPAISPDGRWLVFSVGERGLNTDLFVGELVAGEVRDVRPLQMLNTGFDESAPAFGPDALYFASDRGGAQFGLDLWRAPYADGVFSPAEPIGAGINTASDETDPRPIPGTRGLLFSSNRKRGARSDFDLYLAQPSAAPETLMTSGELEPGDAIAGEAAPAQLEFEVRPLGNLNTPFDERDATLTSDGRTLIFASDRDGSLGGFDLYRSFLEAGEWLPAEALLGVNSYRSERGPLLSADGFSLYFDVSELEQSADLWLAHSKELFRVPSGPLSIYEILGLLALLLLAILAWLSKRWRTLDVIYRCFLISMLVHLFLLWYLREVYPESGPVEIAGNEQRFRVRLASSPSGTPSSAMERNGQLELSEQAQASEAEEPSFTESKPGLAAAAPSAARLARPERELQEPERREAELAEHRSQAQPLAALQDAELQEERYAASAPSLSVESQDTRSERTREASAAPAREASAASQALTGEPAQSSSTSKLVARRDQSERQAAAPGAQRLQALQEAGAPRGPQLALPQESFTAASSDAPALSLPELTQRAAPQRQAGSAMRRELESSHSELPRTGASPNPADLSGLTPEREPSELTSAPRAPGLEQGNPSLALEASQQTLRQAADQEAWEAAPLPSPSFDATAELSRAQGTRVATGALAPARLQGERDPAASQATPSPSRIVGLSVAPPREAPSPLGSLQTSQSPGTARPELAVRDVEESLGSKAAAPRAPARFDATTGLALAEPKRFERKGPQAPQPRAFQSAAQVAPAEPTALSFAAAAPQPEPHAEDLPRRLEHTPYQNRFGEEKLRALDEFGGGVETEQAVADGLAYLAGIQNPDGSWGQASDFDRGKYRDVRIGKSALALLAFLGAGHTPDSDREHSRVARSSVQYLLGIQDGATGHFGDSSSYGHGIATYALAECYALTRDAALRPAIERGIARILAKQDRRRDRRTLGGWGYYFRDDSVWDDDTWPRVSVTSWQVMALESARIGGLEVPQQALDAAQAFLATAWDARRQAFRYSHDPSRLNSGYPILPASTPAALFALSLMGQDIGTPELAPARRFVLKRAPQSYRYSGADDFVELGRGNLYFWYYSTLAMFRVGGAEWSRWNVSMKSTLLDAQDSDGSWRPLSTYSDYAGDDEHERTYSTAMCVLSLEVYYRYFTPLLSK